MSTHTWDTKTISTSIASCGANSCLQYCWAAWCLGDSCQMADKSKFFYDCQPFLAKKINASAQGFQKTWGISDTIGHQDNHGKIHWTSNNSSLVASVIIPPQNPKPFLMTIEKLGHIFQDYEILKHSSIDHHHWHNQQKPSSTPHVVQIAPCNNSGLLVAPGVQLFAHT